jgi:hypothetical protein
MRHAACLPAALPQCPQAIDPAAKAFPGAPVNSWSYTNCSATYCAGAARQHVLCNRTRLPPMPAAQGLGACPAVKYLPGDGYYYVIFAGAPFVYLIRTRDFVTCVAFRFCLPWVLSASRSFPFLTLYFRQYSVCRWEQPQHPFIQPSTDDNRTSRYVGNPQTMMRHGPSWWRQLERWDWNSNDADMVRTVLLVCIHLKKPAIVKHAHF